MRQGRIGLALEQDAPEAVLVEADGIEPGLVALEDGHEMARLHEQPRRPPVGVSGWLERPGHHALEVPDRTVVAAHGVVERNHLADEAGADSEGRRHSCRDRGIGGCPHPRVPLRARQERRRTRPEAAVQFLVELGARHDQRQQQRGLSG